MSSTLSSTDGRGRRLRVPVGSLDADIVATEVMTGETEVIVGEGAVRGLEITEVAGNATVKANRAARLARQVAAERAEACGELLEDDSLSFDFANLLGDDPLGIFLEDEETLLDDFDGLRMADKFLLLFNNGCAER